VIGETVIRQRPGTTTNRYDDTVPDWSDPDLESIDGCALAPELAAEDSDHRQGVVIGWTLYAPAGADIEPSDRIVARGDTYEVDGEPADWRSPFSGRAAGVALSLRRVEG
jgi:hypothetical protein